MVLAVVMNHGGVVGLLFGRRKIRGLECAPDELLQEKNEISNFAWQATVPLTPDALGPSVWTFDDIC